MYKPIIKELNIRQDSERIYGIPFLFCSGYYKKKICYIFLHVSLSMTSKYIWMYKRMTVIENNFLIRQVLKRNILYLHILEYVVYTGDSKCLFTFSFSTIFEFIIHFILLLSLFQDVPFFLVSEVYSRRYINFLSEIHLPSQISKGYFCFNAITKVLSCVARLGNFC